MATRLSVENNKLIFFDTVLNREVARPNMSDIQDVYHDDTKVFFLHRVLKYEYDGINRDGYELAELRDSDNNGFSTIGAVRTYLSDKTGIGGVAGGGGDGGGGTPDSSTSGRLPLKSGSSFVNSAISETTEKVISSKDFEAPSIRTSTNSLLIDNWAFSNGGSSLALLNRANNSTAYPILSEIGSTGSTRAFYHKGGADVITQPEATLNETFTVTNNNDNVDDDFQFILINGADGYVSRYEVFLESDCNDCNFIVRANSHEDGVNKVNVLYDYKSAHKGAGINLTVNPTDVANDGYDGVMVDLSPVLLFFPIGVKLYVTIEPGIGETLAIRGQTLPVPVDPLNPGAGTTNETIPAIRRFGHIAPRKFLLEDGSSATLLGDIDNVGSGSIITNAERAKLVGLSSTPFISDPCITVAATGQDISEIESIDVLEGLQLRLRFNISNAAQITFASVIAARLNGSGDEQISTLSGLSDGNNERTLTFTQADVDQLRTGDGAIIMRILINSDLYNLGCININPRIRNLSLNSSTIFVSLEHFNSLNNPGGTTAWESLNNAFIVLSGNSTFTFARTNVPLNITFLVQGANVQFAADASEETSVTLIGNDLPANGDFIQLRNDGNTLYLIKVGSTT